MKLNYKQKIGCLIQNARQSRNLTQKQLAEALGTSQSAINRIEKGGQNVSLEMLAKISDVLSSELISLNLSGKLAFKINGGKRLAGSIDVKTSKNAAVGLLCASLLNHGTTIIRRVAKIEEVNRIIEVLNSLGVKTRWLNQQNDLEIKPPARLKLTEIDEEAAKKTRSVLMFLGPLLNQYKKFTIPFAGGCNLGTRTVEPHLAGLRAFGLNIEVANNHYHMTVKKTTKEPNTRYILLTERSDTATENVIMASALSEGTTIIRNASPNYMVQDVCFFLQKLGVKIEGIGTTILKITGKKNINKNIDYYPSEDPIEAMSFIAAGVVTNSEITIKRVPIEFVEIELAILASMGLKYEISSEYKARNNETRLVNLKIFRSKLVAPKDKLHCMPFPGVNMDNLPFLGLIATVAKGRTLVHDWSYDNRAIYFTELQKLNAHIELVDPHRVYITGPTKWQPADIISPPALRPSAVIMLAMLAVPGTSTLQNVYSINRGYEDFANRLNLLGADIQTLREV